MKYSSRRVQTKLIIDWTSFHNVFADIMGFPDFYGRNLNAWIDCMTDVDDSGSGMTRCPVAQGELFHLEVADSQDFQRRHPDIFETFIQSAAFVNRRRIESGLLPVLSLVLL